MMEARDILAPDLPFPPDKRVLGGRNAVPIPPGGSTAPLRLHWDGEKDRPGPCRFRFVAASDERVPHEVRVSDAKTGEWMGTVPAYFACPGQAFELALTDEQSRAALRHGLALEVGEGPPMWVFTRGPTLPATLLPSLVPDRGEPATLGRFLDLFCSLASLQPSDWMDICVMDGLGDWANKSRPDAAATLATHLELFFHPVTGRREDWNGRPSDTRPGGPETSGPFARLVFHDPGHPALRLAEEGFECHRNAEHDVVGTKSLVTESCYNVAYPMMAMAVTGRRPDYRERAFHQLRMCRRFLARERDLYLRYHFEDGYLHFPSWSRGVAWYLLGMTRTLALLPPAERPDDLLEEIERVVRWAGTYQQDDGLWSCFLTEPGVSPDSSGSAGIAAAVAIAVREEMVGDIHLSIARKACAALWSRCTPDGWLGGTSQSNKRESLPMDIQHHPFRVAAPWGMGLFAQLVAALDDLNTPSSRP